MKNLLKQDAPNNKISIIIPTHMLPIERLLWTVFSLLAYSDPEGVIEEIIVSICGPDERTGDPLLQNLKCMFVEDLQKTLWKGKRLVPISYCRTWSRLAFGANIETAMPLCKTNNVFILNDDTFIINSAWENDVRKFLTSGNAWANVGPHFAGDLGHSENDGKWQLHLPRIHMRSLIFKKDVVSKLGVRFFGYYARQNFNLAETVNIEKFLAYYHKTPEQFQAKEEYMALLAEEGAWAKYLFEQDGLEHGVLNHLYFKQIVDLSWHEDKTTVEQLEAILQQYPEMHAAYAHNMPANRKDFATANFEEAEISPDIKPIVLIVVYKRYDLLEKWMRAWHNAKQCGAKIAIIHNIDGETPNDSDKEFILGLKPDYYIPRNNIGLHIGAIQDFVKMDYDWNVLVSFTDDSIPMRSDFLLPFLIKISKPNTGLVGLCSEGSYIRTNVFVIKRKVIDKIKWPAEVIVTRDENLRFENKLASQVQQMGYDVELALSDKPGTSNYVHWSYYSEWIWDCEKCYFLNLWDKFEEQFKETTFSFDEKLLVGVIVYNRKDTIDAWLRAWNNAEQYGGKIAVIHNVDDAAAPPEDQKLNITKHNPDHYLVRPNIGMDIAALQFLSKSNLNWDVLLWSTDDVLPMRKDFAKDFLEKIKEPGVGLVGQYSEGGYIRTNCFCIRKEVLSKIIDDEVIETREDCHRFEQKMHKLVENAGYKVKHIHSQKPGNQNELHWTQHSYWMWDTGIPSLNLWDKFDQQFDKQCKILVGVIVYNRQRNIEKWLRAWNNADKYGAKLAVYHNHDGEEPPESMKTAILSYKPDFYIPRKNSGWDIAALQQLILQKDVPYDWDVLVWFTDDFLPMKKDFLNSFIVQIKKPDVDMTGLVFESNWIRSVGFAVKKTVAEKWKWPAYPITTRMECLRFENYDFNFSVQTLNMGYKVSPVVGGYYGSAEYKHWSQFSDWMWDAGNFGEANLWDMYERQFTC